MRYVGTAGLATPYSGQPNVCMCAHVEVSSLNYSQQNKTLGRAKECTNTNFIG